MNRYRRIFLILLLLFLSDICRAQKLQVICDDELKGYTDLKTYHNVEYISLKDVAKICSGRLSWYSISGKVIFSIANHRICFFFESKDVIIDTEKIKLSSPVYFTKGDDYVPIDFFLSEEFTGVSDYKIKYDIERKIIFFDRVINLASPRVYSDNGITRLSIELSEKLSYDIKRTAKKEYTITFFRGKAIPEEVNFKNEYIKQVILKNRYNQTECRLKLTDGNIKLNYQLKKNPVRFEITLCSPDIKPATGIELTDQQVGEPVTTSTTTALLTPTQKIVEPARERKIKIVIDPGHGGENPGAVGPHGTEEKNINLSISKELARLFEEDNYEVILTRKEDVFIPLVDRTQLANEKSADFFVSIHCNASIKKHTSGFEIYFLSEKASDPEAAAVAARENEVIKLEGKPTKQKEKLQELLWSMVVNEFMNESSELCSFITNEVTNRIKIENLGIKQAGFYVLRGAQMPAVLVECGFLSNPDEEAKLRSGRFQKQMADSIYSGIKRYVRRKNMVSVNREL